jgi:hypothetical protein
LLPGDETERRVDAEPPRVPAFGWLEFEERRMQPYVVRENDFLLKIAFEFGFDADSVWNAPNNDDLRRLRPNPNQLFPGDVL